jgi:hypothetical protein
MLRGFLDKTEENEEEPTWIKILQDLLINTNGPKIPAILNTIYSDFQNNCLNTE